MQPDLVICFSFADLQHHASVHLSRIVILNEAKVRDELAGMRCGRIAGPFSANHRLDAFADLKFLPYR